jgi:hypothetical protein
MTDRPAYRIDIEGDEMVIRIRRDSVDLEDLSRFLDYIVLKSIQRKSELTEDAAAALADEIDRAVWKRVRHRYESPGS